MISDRLCVSAVRKQMIEKFPFKVTTIKSNRTHLDRPKDASCSGRGRYQVPPIKALALEIIVYT
ncbi:MAG: hypothetical protein K0R18_2664 [Bacillales bacterium]|jgi:hypothetical protein|nr:hypothetical protein [Bacillales bacterium]